MKKIALVLPFLFLGCTGPEKAREPQPQPQLQPQPQPQPDPTTNANNTAPQEETATITIKKGDKRNPEASYKGDPPPGQVCFDFERVDLEKVALPLFSRQAGVTIDYGSKTRKTLSLRFNQPVPWRDALALICKFTDTHIIRSQIPGRLEMKDGYADPTPIIAKFDPNDRTRNDSGAGVIGADGQSVPGASSTQTIGPSPSSQTPSQDPEYRDPSQDYNDKVDQIRKG